MQKFFRNWMRVALIDLTIVAFAGVIMRYKIAFSLPFIDQKYLMHAHSHFAFSGWITQALMVLLTAYLAKRLPQINLKKYNAILWANVLTAFGMLFTFPFEGYGLYSIIFSTLSIFVSYAFAIVYWTDLNKITTARVSHKWFKAAVLFNAISSYGAFSLAYMMATHSVTQNGYLESIYFFLHFQYNGWFFFACMGLLTEFLLRHGVNARKLKQVFYLFAFACVPAYFLSVLWIDLSTWIYSLVVLAVIAQLVALVSLIQLIRHSYAIIMKRLSAPVKRLTGFAAVALIIKLLLQAASVIPSLSDLTTGFRPIVIGYLHLVFLGIITLFILSYALHYNYISIKKRIITGIAIFTAGIILNEFLLMVQGIGALEYQSLPYMNYYLLLAALIMFVGLLCFALKPFTQTISPSLPSTLPIYSNQKKRVYEQHLS
ncbi:MAG: hypothetical protein ACTHJ5_05995 [Ilyomonas sp.]